MLLSSEPASQNWSAELMLDTSSVCWKSTPVPCAHDTIVLVPPLQATAHTQARCVAWLRRPASLHWRCGACLCVLTTRSATPSQTLEKAVLPLWQEAGGQLFKSPDCLMSVCSIYLLFKEELLWFPPSPLYFLLFSSHFLVTFSTSLSLMRLLLILPPSTEPLSPTLQRTVLCCLWEDKYSLSHIHMNKPRF